MTSIAASVSKGNYRPPKIEHAIIDALCIHAALNDHHRSVGLCNRLNQHSLLLIGELRPVNRPAKTDDEIDLLCTG